jgi:hypothetical protein
MNQEQIAIGPMLMILAAIVGVAVVIPLLIRAGMGSRADAERAKLFEMGYYLPRRPSRWPQSLFCTAMGLGVPVAALVFASTRTAFTTDAWIAACIISVSAIVGATIVAAIAFVRPEPSGQPEKLVTSTAKPASDPDALDFAGRLGRN